MDSEQLDTKHDQEEAQIAPLISTLTENENETEVTEVVNTNPAVIDTSKYVVDDLVTSTFVPNIDEQHISQEQQIENFVTEFNQRGELVPDIKWDRGHSLFICQNDDHGGDIT